MRLGLGVVADRSDREAGVFVHRGLQRAVIGLRLETSMYFDCIINEPTDDTCLNPVHIASHGIERKG